MPSGSTKPTGRFKSKGGQYPAHECRLHYLLECTNSVRYWPPWIVEEGDMTSFLFRTYDWRWWRKRVPTYHRPSKRSIMARRFRRETAFSFFVFNEPICRYSNVRLQKRFTQIIEVFACVGPILSHIYRPKLILYWNEATTGNYANYTHFRTKVQMSMSFSRNRPWNFARVFYMSTPRPDLRFFFFCRRIYLV